MTLPAAVHVRVVGTGLIGTSIGLALTAHGCGRLARGPLDDRVRAGAGPRGGRAGGRGAAAPALVVVAAPPDAVAAVVVARAGRVAGGGRHRRRVGEGWPCWSRSRRLGGDLRPLRRGPTRWPGGSARARSRRRPTCSRAAAGCVAPGPAAGEAAVAAVLDLAVAVGAAPVRMTPADHDAAVAAVSHVPQIAASLVAARLRELPDSAVALAGQGIRDVTRIAASDPMMWTQILAGNAPAAARRCWRSWRPTSTRCCRPSAPWTLGARHGGDGHGARGVLARAVASGNAGHARIPGKHGSAPTAYATVTVLVPDEPGALGRLFHDVGEAGINLEDLHLEHGIGAPVGLAELAVLPASARAARPAPCCSAAGACTTEPAVGAGRRAARAPVRGGQGALASNYSRRVTEPAAALVIAIDGPSGSGKSSVSRAVARTPGPGLPRHRGHVPRPHLVVPARGRRPRRPRGGRRGGAPAAAHDGHRPGRAVRAGRDGVGGRRHPAHRDLRVRVEGRDQPRGARRAAAAPARHHRRLLRHRRRCRGRGP